MKQLAFATLCMVTLAGLAACNKNSTSDIAGTYTARWNFGQETLVLKSDGNYEQKFVPSNRALQPAKNQGRWEFDGHTLRLNDPIMVFDPYGDGINPNYAKKNANAVSLFTASSRLGRLAFSASANSDVSYERQ